MRICTKRGSGRVATRICYLRSYTRVTLTAESARRLGLLSAALHMAGLRLAVLRLAVLRMAALRMAALRLAALRCA